MGLENGSTFARDLVRPAGAEPFTRKAQPLPKQMANEPIDQFKVAGNPFTQDDLSGIATSMVIDHFDRKNPTFLMNEPLTIPSQGKFWSVRAVMSNGEAG